MRRDKGVYRITGSWQGCVGIWFVHHVQDHCRNRRGLDFTARHSPPRRSVNGYHFAGHYAIQGACICSKFRTFALALTVNGRWAHLRSKMCRWSHLAVHYSEEYSGFPCLWATNLAARRVRIWWSGSNNMLTPATTHACLQGGRRNDRNTVEFRVWLLDSAYPSLYPGSTAVSSRTGWIGTSLERIGPSSTRDIGFAAVGKSGALTADFCEFLAISKSGVNCLRQVHCGGPMLCIRNIRAE